MDQDKNKNSSQGSAVATSPTQNTTPPSTPNSTGEPLSGSSDVSEPQSAGLADMNKPLASANEDMSASSDVNPLSTVSTTGDQSIPATSSSPGADGDVALPSVDRGQDEPPKTVNSTAASLGNVDPGLAAPITPTNPVSGLNDISSTQPINSSIVNDPGVATQIDDANINPNVSTSINTPNDPPIPTEPGQNSGSVLNQGIPNKITEEAGSSGNNN